MKIEPEVAYRELHAQYEQLRQRNLVLAQSLHEAIKKLEELTKEETENGTPE